MQTNPPGEKVFAGKCYISDVHQITFPLIYVFVTDFDDTVEKPRRNTTEKIVILELPRNIVVVYIC